MLNRAASSPVAPQKIEATVVRFDQIRLALPGMAYVHPVPMLSPSLRDYLCAVANDLGDDIGFSRESPRRVRSVHHLVPQVVEALEQSGMCETFSTWAGERLAIHPSAHFGCSFNWTASCYHGDSDPWHLDAAPYTAIILLSEPELQFNGGDLSLFIGDPPVLWQAIRCAKTVPETSVWRVPFFNSGDTFLFQGKHLAHRVGPVTTGTEEGLVGVKEGRLTLAIGLYSADSPQRWLYPGVAPSDGLVRDCWRIESKKARLLAAIERVRQAASWQRSPEAAVESESAIDDVLTRFE